MDPQPSELPYDPDPDVRWAALGHREEQGGRATVAAMLRATDDTGRITAIASVQHDDSGEINRLATLTGGRPLATGGAAGPGTIEAAATWDVVPDPEGQPGTGLVCLSLDIRPGGQHQTWTVLRIPVPRLVPGLETLSEARRLIVTTASLTALQAGRTGWETPAYVVRFGETLERVAAVCATYRALTATPAGARHLLGARAELWERLTANLPEVAARARTGGLAVIAGVKTVTHPARPGFTALIAWVEPADAAEIRRQQQLIDAESQREIAMRYSWHAIPPDPAAPTPTGLVALSWASILGGGTPRWMVLVFPLPEQFATLRAIATFQATLDRRYRPVVLVMAREPIEDEDWSAPNVVLNLGREPAREVRAILDWYRRWGGTGSAR